MIEDISEREISVTATHISNLEAQVRLDVNIFQGLENRDVHIQDGDPFAVQYTVWDADSEEELDSGDWSDSAGEDAIGPSRVLLVRSGWTLTTIEG